jgi:hypothetical protein
VRESLLEQEISGIAEVSMPSTTNFVELTRHGAASARIFFADQQ